MNMSRYKHFWKFVRNGFMAERRCVGCGTLTSANAFCVVVDCDTCLPRARRR